MGDYSGHPGGLGEAGTLARLTIAEKRRLARAAILGFPHLDHATLDGWLRDHGVDTVSPNASLGEKTDQLLDSCETLVRSGEDPEALDHFLNGQLYPANLETHGIDPHEVAGREPLDTWDGVYEDS